MYCSPRLFLYGWKPCNGPVINRLRLTLVFFVAFFFAGALRAAFFLAAVFFEAAFLPGDFFKGVFFAAAFFARAAFLLTFLAAFLMTFLALTFLLATLFLRPLAAVLAVVFFLAGKALSPTPANTERGIIQPPQLLSRGSFLLKKRL